MPEHGLVHLLELRKENLEIVEVQIDGRSPCLGKEVSRGQAAADAQLIAVVRDGEAHLATESRSPRERRPGPGLLQPGREEDYVTHCWDTSGVAIVLVAVPAVAGARIERNQLRVVLVAPGFDAPVHVAATPSEPARLAMCGATGPDLCAEQKQASPGPGHSRPGRLRWIEQGLLLDGLPSQLCEEPALLRQLPDTQRPHPRRRIPPDGRQAGDTARRILFVPQPYANHSGGLQFGPTGSCTSAWETADPAAIRTTTGRIPERCSRSSCARTRWQSTGRSRATASAIRGSSRSTTTGDLYIGDVGQNAREEIDYRPRGAPTANFGWAQYEGSRLFEGDVDLDPPSPLVFPIHEYGHGEGCSVTGGYVYPG